MLTVERKQVENIPDLSGSMAVKEDVRAALILSEAHWRVKALAELLDGDRSGEIEIRGETFLVDEDKLTASVRFENAAGAMCWLSINDEEVVFHRGPIPDAPSESDKTMIEYRFDDPVFVDLIEDARSEMA